MKILFVFGTTAMLLAGSLTGTLLAEQSEEAPKVDPKAREIIGRAVDYLASAKQFRVTAENLAGPRGRSGRDGAVQQGGGSPASQAGPAAARCEHIRAEEEFLL